MQVQECFGNCDLSTLGALLSSPHCNITVERKNSFTHGLTSLGFNTENQTDGQQRMNMRTVRHITNTCYFFILAKVSNGRKLNCYFTENGSPHFYKKNVLHPQKVL